jgi:hypothetical protein
MNFKYTDLAKFQNYIGFESGVWCNFPNYHGRNHLLENEEAEANFGCTKPRKIDDDETSDTYG